MGYLAGDEPRPVLIEPKHKVHLSAQLHNRIVPLCTPSANYTVSENKDKVTCRVCLDKAKFYE